jgi:hypothetical protein
VAACVLAAAAAATGFAGGCAASSDAVDSERRAVVYGDDDRVEYFDVSSASERDLMSGSVVAFVPHSSIKLSDGAIRFDAPSLGQAANLCPGEAFAEQPAAAFCSGVLIDWDLVLTAGHCVHLLALSDFRVVFGYYYDRPGHLATSLSDVATPIEIVADRLDPQDVSPRLDYALLRLEHAVAPPHRPVPVYIDPPRVASGDPVVSIGAGSGVPLKLDAGGEVQDVRSKTVDYFTATTDTSGGSSGGGAFDHQGALIGVLARGADDLTLTSNGCQATNRLPDSPAAQEQFTFVHSAVDELCGHDPGASSLCRSDCGDPCHALPPTEDAGCTIGSRLQADRDPRRALVAICISFAITGRRRTWRAKNLPAPRRE